MRRLLLLSVALIVYGSLYPWHFDFSRGPAPAILLSSWPTHWDRWDMRDGVLNVLLYAPLGLAGFLLLARRLPRASAFAVATAAGAVLSVTMELSQVYVPGRTPSLFDVLTNSVGTVAGAIVGMTLGGRVLAALKPRAHRSAAGAGILLASWASYQLFPFFPIVSQTRLRAAVHLWMHSGAPNPVEIWVAAAEWFAAALALEAWLGSLDTRWLAACMLCCLLRVFVPTRTLTVDELAGAALGLAMWAMISKGSRQRAGLWFLLGAILLGELAPFRFSGPPAAFSWIPFTGAFDNERWAALVILSGKVFEYGAAVWLLARAGLGYFKSGAVIAGALFVLELAQCYLPGRVPEIADPLLALLMAFSLWAASDIAARRGLR